MSDAERAYWLTLCAVWALFGLFEGFHLGRHWTPQRTKGRHAA